MRSQLAIDHDRFPELLNAARAEAVRFLSGLSDRPVNHPPLPLPRHRLPRRGIGAGPALERFTQAFASTLTGSAGPRYFGFVTGGSTPAALVGDWLTGAFDQNASDTTSTAAAHLEAEAVDMARELFGLPDDFAGRFVTGATMSNFVGLAIGRQWWGERFGRDIAEEGWHDLPPLTVLSGAPHSCVFKCLAMLGIGRKNLRAVATLPGREAVDVTALRAALEECDGRPCIVVANAGVVNSADFDDFAAIADLKREFDFHLHVDAAFGGFAACSPRFAHLVSGWEAADSIAVDCHKWLNVPYDSGLQFTRHLRLQARVFQNVGAAYLGEPNTADALHLTPENSRRLRALAAWFTLTAYGADGYREIVEANCDRAAQLGALIAASPRFRLLAPVRMNVVPFTLDPPDEARIRGFLDRLRDGGAAFLTPTTYQGVRGMRAAFSNWRTHPADVEQAWEGMLAALES